MNWDQIETKWAAMTLRVQAEWKPRVDAAKSASVTRTSRTPTTPLVSDLLGSSQPASGTPTVE